jgi:hypothetical protein
MGAMVMGARAPQIWLNFRRGNSGELSIITTALQLSGNLVIAPFQLDSVRTVAALSNDPRV